MRLQSLTIAAGALMLGSIGVTPALADPIALTVSSGPTLQQTVNSPCVIGDPSCQNPPTLPYTLLGPSDSADTVSSPTYTVDQVRAIAGDTFDVGLDVNQSAGSNSGAYILESFGLMVDGTTMFSTTGANTVTSQNAGNGFSDATISGFDLSGLSGSSSLVFTTTFSGGTAGREQYFLSGFGLNGGSGGLSETPEPGTWILLASGVLGLLALRRRLVIA